MDNVKELDPTSARAIDLEAANARLEEKSAVEILKWAWERFGEDAIVTSSFQTQSVPLLHLIGRAAPGMEVIFIDTGFHFPETLAFRDRLQRDFGLKVRSIHNKLGVEGFKRHHGQLYRRDPDLCCYLNKVEPLDQALTNCQAWISGIRRDQTEARRHTPVIAQLDDGTYKICPMVRWTDDEVRCYIAEHDLPEHPLTSQGYASIGCAPCTQCAGDGSSRGGRWAGTDKTECGLHTDLGKHDKPNAKPIRVNFGDKQDD